MLEKPRGSARIFRFGVFETDAETGELRKDGKLQPRPREQAFRILLMLLERPRELVTREEIRDRLWSADTFVDFDHGVNAAINQLRVALGDEAANPRFIQTVPRRGYRFIAPVEIVRTANQGSALSPSQGADHKETESPPLSRRASDPASGETSPSPEEAPRFAVLSDPRDLPAVPGGVARTLFLLIQLIYLTFYVLSLARFPEVRALLTEAGGPVRIVLVPLIVTAATGIPIRLYFISAAAFKYRGLSRNFLRLFPFLLPLDELWALAPFLAVAQIGAGLALAVTAALLYLPFAQRSLLLMERRATSNT